jgi:hypothetical protein
MQSSRHPFSDRTCWNTHVAVSDIRHDVTNTQIAVSNIHRTMLERQEETEDHNCSVNHHHTPLMTELILIVI